MFCSICNALCESRSLEAIKLHGPPVDDMTTEKAVEYLAKRLLWNHHQWNMFIFPPSGSSGRCTMDAVCHALSRTTAVKNSNVSFRRTETQGGSQDLTLVRDCWWKSVLPQSIPLNLWPVILAKANSWENETSHRPLDILYFLMREKNDVFLQHMQRRCNRKCKWFQFTEYGLLGCSLFAVLAYCSFRMTNKRLNLSR